MLNCRESTALMSESRERDLTLAERMGLRLHWAMCSACRRFDRQLDVLRAAARRYAARDDRITPDQDETPPR